MQIKFDSCNHSAFLLSFPLSSLTKLRVFYGEKYQAPSGILGERWGYQTTQIPLAPAPKLCPRQDCLQTNEAYTTEKSRLQNVFLLADGTKIAAQKVKTGGEWHLETRSARPGPDQAFA